MTSGIQRPLLCGPVRRPSDELPASEDADQSVHADAVLQDYVQDARPDQGRSDNAGQNEKYAVGRVKITETLAPVSSVRRRTTNTCTAPCRTPNAGPCLRQR